MFLRILIAVGVLASFNAYAASRFINRWPWAERHLVAAWALAAFFFALQLLGPFGDHLLFPRWRREFDAHGLVSVLDWASYLALGMMSCAFVYGVVIDIGAILLHWFVIPDAAQTDINRRALLTLGAATLGTAALGVGQAVAGPTVRKVEIPLRNLPSAFDGFKIVQISDLHVGPTIRRAYVENVVSIANGLSPDLIALTGDFVDGDVEDLWNEVLPLADLRAPHGKYYITGNHEYYWDAEAWAQAFTKLGARVLLNEHEVIVRDGAQIVLAGVTDYSTLRSASPQAMSPRRSLIGAPTGVPKILLAHQPASYALAHEAGFDLQLSGHTHAGQYFPFTLLIGLFQRYYKGLNRHEDMWVYVNSGTGYWGPPLRTGVPTEITEITLRVQS